MTTKTESAKPKRKLRKYRTRRQRKFITGEHLSTKTGLRHKFRSSWERDYMQWLDAQVDVLHYDYESVIIAYVIGKSTRVRKYYPDFVIDYADGSRVICEIKSSRFVNANKNHYKFVGARQFCAERGWKFIILTEVELRALGLLKGIRRAARVIKKEKSELAKRRKERAAKKRESAEAS